MENVLLHTAGALTQGVVLSHVLSVVCQLLFCCPPLLMEISEPPFPPNPLFELRHTLCWLDILIKIVGIESY